MHIADNWRAPICYINKVIVDLAISDKHFKHVPHFDGFYTYQLEGDFIKYVKRV